MIEVVGVRYHDVGQIYFYTPKKQTYTINDQVIVESQDAKCLATVVTKSREMNESDLPQVVKPGDEERFGTGSSQSTSGR